MHTAPNAWTKLRQLRSSLSGTPTQNPPPWYLLYLGNQLAKSCSAAQKWRSPMKSKTGRLHDDERASLVWRRHRLVDSSTNRRTIIYGDLVVCLLDVWRRSTKLCKVSPLTVFASFLEPP